MEISLLILKRITRSVGREVEKVGAKVKGGGGVVPSSYFLGGQNSKTIVVARPNCMAPQGTGIWTVLQTSSKHPHPNKKESLFLGV